MMRVSKGVWVLEKGRSSKICIRRKGGSLTASHCLFANDIKDLKDLKEAINIFQDKLKNETNDKDVI